MSTRLSLLGLCSFAFAASVLCVDNLSQNHRVKENFKTDEQSFGQGIKALYWPNFKFQCPSAFGAYPDPEDCAYFYICVAKVGSRTRCPYMYRFDKNSKMCLPLLMAVCDDSGKTTTEVITSKDTKFTCPSMIGKFLHPQDCSKYYSCTIFISTLKTCPESELFDGVKKQCRPAKEVHCGSRINPNDEITISETTPETLTSPIGPEITSETESVNEETETSPEDTTPTVTDIDTESSSVAPRVTAPDTDCDEDDLDCIIDDLGEKPEWFVCPKDIGSYPHPTSRKLFIFCLNWWPSVKKCGQNLVFSNQLMTCVSP